MAEGKVKNTDEITPGELFSNIGKWFRFVFSKWLTILVIALVGGAFGLAYTVFVKPVYTARLNFVLEEGEAPGGLGQYAGLASMVGIDLDGGGGGIFKGDNIIELYKSRTMIEKTLLSIVNVDGKKQLLIDRYIEFNKLRKKWDKDTYLRTVLFTDSANFTVRQDSVISKIVKDINKKNLLVNKPDKKLNIIQVQFKSEDEAFAKAFTDQIVSNVSSFYVKTKTKKSLENLAILQRQTDSVKKELFSNIRSVAASADANVDINPARQILRTPSQNKQVDAKANEAILTELVKNLEISKASLRKETPLIEIIDRPVLPLDEDSMGTAKGIVFGGVLFAFLAVLVLSVRRLAGGLKN